MHKVEPATKDFGKINQLIHDIEEKLTFFHRLFTKSANVDYFLEKNIAKRIEVCLDTIGDTLMGVKDYLNSDIKYGSGFNYLCIYGVLQMLFVQQDAVGHLYGCLRDGYAPQEELTQIRNVRNLIVGHPTDKKINKISHYAEIIRMTLEKYSFTSLVEDEKGNFESKNYDVIDLIKTQFFHVNNELENIKKIMEDDPDICMG